MECLRSKSLGKGIRSQFLKTKKLCGIKANVDLAAVFKTRLVSIIILICVSKVVRILHNTQSTFGTWYRVLIPVVYSTRQRFFRKLKTGILASFSLDVSQTCANLAEIFGKVPNRLFKTVLGEFLLLFKLFENFEVFSNHRKICGHDWTVLKHYMQHTQQLFWLLIGCIFFGIG